MEINAQEFASLKVVFCLCELCFELLSQLHALDTNYHAETRGTCLSYAGHRYSSLQLKPVENVVEGLEFKEPPSDRCP